MHNNNFLQHSRTAHHFECANLFLIRKFLLGGFIFRRCCLFLGGPMPINCFLIEQKERLFRWIQGEVLAVIDGQRGESIGKFEIDG
jgi:hypothetical protein